MADHPASPLVALTRAEIAAAGARCAQLKLTKNVFGDMEILIVPDPKKCGRELHFIAHDGCCILCGGGHARAIQHAGPAGTFTDLPRALVGNAAFLELVERIEQRIDKLDFDICEAESIGAPYQGLERRRDELRALLSPPKEPR